MSETQRTARDIKVKLGIPVADEDGTFRIKHEVKDGEVRLLCDGHPFVVCKVDDGQPVVQFLDIDTGVVFERNIAVLAWRR